MPDDVAAPAPSAPAPSAPSPAPSTPSPAPSTGASEPYSNLGSYDDLDSVEVSGDSVVPSDGTAVADASADAHTPVPAEAEAKPVPAAAKPVQEPAKAQPADASAPGPAEPDNSPQGLVQQLEHHRGAVLNALAAERFKLSPEEVSAIDTDAVAAIPHIMARTYYEAMQSTLLHIQNMVPQVVLNAIKAQKASDEVETSFYKQFAALDKAKHQSDVLQFARMLRASNPQITQPDLFAMVGAAVMAKHQLQNPPPAHGGNGITPPRQSQPAPFVPATPGATVRTIPEKEAPFAGLGRDWDE